MTNSLLEPTETIKNILATNPTISKAGVITFNYSDAKNPDNGQIEIQIMPELTVINLLFSTKEDKIILNLDNKTVVKFNYNDADSIDLLMNRWIVPLVGGKKSLFSFSKAQWEADIAELDVNTLAKLGHTIEVMRNNLNNLGTTSGDNSSYNDYVKLAGAGLSRAQAGEISPDEAHALLTLGRTYNEKTLFWFNALKSISEIVLKDKDLADILRVV